MILISHRGNTNGKEVELENTISHIENAIKLGFDVEIDVWLKKEEWWLGHDLPQYKISHDFLTMHQLWIHCKNPAAFYKLHETKELNYFWHEKDKIVLTSKGHVWLLAGQPIEKNVICVLPEINNYTVVDLQICEGVCSDFICNYKHKYHHEHCNSIGWQGEKV